MEKNKKYVKIADMFLDSLYGLKQKRLQEIKSNLEDFSKRCFDAAKNSHRFNMAVDRNFLMAAEKVRSKINRDLNEFLHHFNQFKNFISIDETKLPEIGEIVSGIFQLEQEYGNVNIDLKAKAISVTTDPIVMDEINLGGFEIKLFLHDIKNLYNDSPYKIIALNPNPAGTDCNVTHPHVSSEKLCEGDGHIPLRKAIEQGRLCDFYMIIMQILQTYNPDSPYVSLEDWCGVCCYDCGYNMSRDETYYCESCDHDYCESCSSYCRACDMTTCLGCGGQCSVCDDFICPDCMKKCVQCDTALCKNCIEENLCPDCINERNNDEEYEEEQIGTEILTDSMG